MRSPSPTVRAVLFDADGVVQRTKPGWLDEVKRLCGNHEDTEGFLRDVFEAEAPCLLGAGDFEASLSSVLQKWDSSATLSEALDVWTMIEPDAAVLGLLRSLRDNGTMIALATNQQRHRAEFMLNSLGYAHEFDHILCSCFMGHAKPDVQYFSKSVGMLGIPAEEMLFIDDHDRNVESAKVAGLRSHSYHLDEGLDTLRSLLEHYGLTVR